MYLKKMKKEGIKNIFQLTAKGIGFATESTIIERIPMILISEGCYRNQFIYIILLPMFK
jgi:hypothetical protein